MVDFEKKLEKMIETTSKQEIQERVAQWLDALNMDNLDTNAENTVQFAQELGNIEDSVAQAWCGEIVSGAHGHYTRLLFCDEILGWSAEGIMYRDTMQDAFINEPYELIEDQGGLADKIADAIADRLNNATRLTGTYLVSHHEADNSLGILYTEVIQ